MNPYANIRPFDGNAINQRVMQSYAQGRQMKQERDTKNALMQYFGAQLAPGDQSSQQAAEGIRAVMQANPQLGMQLMQQHQGQQQKTQQQQIEMVGRAAAMADTPEKWDQIIDQLAMEGIPGVEKYKGRFSPGLRAAIMAKAGVGEQRQNEGPASIQEYQFAKQQGFQGSYMDFMEEKRGPIVANNGDGTFTLIPRGSMPQQGGNAAPPPPPPGFVIDDGGPTQPASGGFPGN